MDFRFTLSHTPKQPVESDITLPDNSLGQNVDSVSIPSRNDWTEGSTPSVTVSGSVTPPDRESEKWVNDYSFSTGLEYTINYNVDYDRPFGATATVNFLILDGANNILLTDSHFADAISGTGTVNGSYTFTAPAGAVKYGFQCEVTNSFANVGTFFQIQNNITGTVSSEGEPGIPTSLQISEPDGWKGCQLVLERHDDFHSLVEYYEGGASGAFIFYGNNGQENGGIDYLRHLEDVYGFDVRVEILTEFSFDSTLYESIFSGQLDISAKDETVVNQMQVPIIRDDLWTKFINRRATQIDLSSNVDLDGKPVDPVTPVTVNLTSQATREQYSGVSTSPGITQESLAIIVEGTYYQMSYDDVDLDEIEEVFNLLQATNPVEPQGWLETKYAGTYSFEFQTVAHDYNPAYNFTAGQELGDYIRFYLNINGVETEFDLGDTFTSSLIDGGRVYTLNLQNQVLPAKSIIKVYGRAIADLTESSPGYSGQIRWNGPVIGATINHDGDFSVGNIECYARITADTIFPDTTAQGFLIHDLFYAVLQRMGLGQSPFYSEFLGSTLTKCRQYEDDGCGSMYVILKGLQVRQYSLSEKPFFISFNQIWDGIHPILCLGLSYEQMDDSPASYVIRVEQMDHFFSDEVSLNISNVRDIHSYYDKDRIFKTIRTGFKKWQSEESSGIDDPQTKHSYATRFEKVGKDLILESDFIAAGLALEGTRRTTIEKSADYKYDNDNFIVWVSPTLGSPEIFSPELDENFDVVSGLLNPESRYNLILTPMRTLLRWAKYIGGCMQPYSTSAYRFVSGEGNYNMLTDYSCTTGNQCQAVICDPLSERQDISLTDYNSVFGYLHLAQECEMTIPMTKDQYDVIKNNRKKSIGISQTDSNFTKFKIKKLVYNLIEGTATITAWPKTPFRIQVINDPIEMPDCTPVIPYVCPDEFDYEVEYKAIIDYARAQGYRPPSCEQRLIQNQMVIDLKAAGAWSELDILYVFATDGDSDFATINWINPGVHKCTKVNSPNFIENIGFEGNGTNAYLDTNWIPSVHGVNFTLNDACGICYLNNDVPAEGKVDFGTRASAGTLGQFTFVSKSVAGGHAYAINSSGTSVGSSVSSDGLYHIRRVANNDQRLFKNGTQIGATGTQVTNSLSNRNLVLLAENVVGTVGGFSTKQISMFGTGASLSGSESTIYNIWNDYFTSI